MIIYSHLINLNTEESILEYCYNTIIWKFPFLKLSKFSKSKLRLSFFIAKRVMHFYIISTV